MPYREGANLGLAKKEGMYSKLKLKFEMPYRSMACVVAT